MAAYSFVGIKANLNNLAPFCSLGDSIYWSDFQRKVFNGTIIEIQDINCEEKCFGKSFVDYIVMHSLIF